MQRKYKISLSNCDLIKIYQYLNIDNVFVKNLITKKTKLILVFL